MKIDELRDEIAGLEDAEIKKLIDQTPELQRERDRHTAQALESYRRNHPAGEPDPETVLAEREEKIARKEKALELATNRGFDPTVIYRLFGLDDSTDEERVEALEAFAQGREMQIKQQILDDHARTIEHGDADDLTPLTLEEISRLPEDRQRALPPEVTERAIANSTAKSTVRDTVKNRLFGGGK